MVETIQDEHFRSFDTRIDNQADYDLALRHAPLIRFDRNEPFFPSVVGYSVFRGTSASWSFPRVLKLPEGATTVIEYAVWWDWDIGHLYELEHIWVYLDDSENIVRIDASWHGGWSEMLDENGQPPVYNLRAIVHSEPGKHAFAATIKPLEERRPITGFSCGKRAGLGGVLVTAVFKGKIHDRNPLNNQLVHTYLERRAFEPSYEFDNIFDLRETAFVPWDNLSKWIPSRVHWWCEQLKIAIPPHQRRVLRIAHRGASAHAQESSPEAIQKAAELGSDMVEIDVRFTADNIPVVAHDSNLKRVYGVEGNIGEMTLDEINAVTPSDRAPLLTFDAMAQLCRQHGMGLYLDFKSINLEGMQSVVQSLRETWLFNYTIFSSFRADWVAEFKAQIPGALTSILFSSVHVDPVALGKAVNADFVHPCWERFDAPHEYLSPEWLDAVESAGFGVVCWHEERPAVIAELNARGVYGICSDNPELLVP